MSTPDTPGEFDFIRSIHSLFGSSPDVIQGVGDDCAVIRVGDRIQLVSTDAFIEGVHFRRDWSTPEDIGWKAAVAALSDIHAMGGRSQFVLTSLAAPKSWSADELQELYRGIQGAVSASGAVVIGGDTTRSPQGLMLDVTVIGEAVDGHYRLRKGAQAGDALVVTGHPGRSRAGLLALEHGVDAPEAMATHIRPQSIKGAPWELVQHKAVHAMMDVSDGLAQDAGHLANAAGLGVDLLSDHIAADAVIEPVCAALDTSLSDIVFTGGEDYELLMAVAPDQVESLPIPVQKLGTFTDSFEGVRIDGESVDAQGFDHFRD